MRTLTELFVIGALIYLGWEQSFKERVDQVRERVDQVRAKVTGKQTQAAPQEIVAMTPTPPPAPRIVPGIIREPTPQHGAWRLDPRHRSPLDPPQASPSPP
jgi:type II secretory pathway component PulM